MSFLLVMGFSGAGRTMLGGLRRHFFEVHDFVLAAPRFRMSEMGLQQSLKGRARNIFLHVLCVVAAMASGFAEGRDKKGAVPLLPENVEMFLVRTRSEQNREVPFYLRKPVGFDPSVKGIVHRVLVICPVINGDALVMMRGKNQLPPLLALADERGWFVLSATFKQEGRDVRDRKKSYYYPEAFSGKAVLEALDLVAKKYPVDTTRLLLQGLSGGAQFVHRFALWVPERVTAVAVNSSSWFDEPNPKSALCAWLLTIGDSDASFANSLEFVTQLQENGASPVFRSYLGMVHEGGREVDALNAAFLTFYDDLTRTDLGKPRGIRERQDPPRSLSGMAMPFVGDSQDWKYYPNTPDNRDNLAPDTRIFLPDESIARLWGRLEEER